MALTRLIPITTILLVFGLACISTGVTLADGDAGVGAPCSAQNIVLVGAQPWALSSPTPTPTPTLPPPSNPDAIAGVVKTQSGDPMVDALVVVLGIGVVQTDSSGRFEIAGATPGQEYTAFIVQGDGQVKGGPFKLTAGASKTLEVEIGQGQRPVAGCKTRSILANTLTVAQVAALMRARAKTELPKIASTGKPSDTDLTRRVGARIYERFNYLLLVLAKVPTAERQCGKAVAQCKHQPIKQDKNSLLASFRALRNELLSINRLLIARKKVAARNPLQLQRWAVQRFNTARRSVNRIPNSSDACS